MSFSSLFRLPMLTGTSSARIMGYITSRTPRHSGTRLIQITLRYSHQTMTSTILLPLVLLGIFSHSTGSALERRDVPRPGNTIIQFGGSQATYLGCYREPQNGRALTKLSFADDGMTNQACGQACESEGFPVFGTEYSRGMSTAFVYFRF